MPLNKEGNALSPFGGGDSTFSAEGLKMESEGGRTGAKKTSYDE